MKYSYSYDTLFGNLTIITENDFLIGILFDKNNIGTIQETPLIKKVKKQIDEYLVGNRKKFDIPVKLIGTSFQVKVWKELTRIGYGECVSYQVLAEQIKNKKYARAIGMANNKNPIPIIVPCHRVIGKNGSLVGYAGGLDKKVKLIELENKYK